MRQRAMIALALCCGPQLLLADEPTTALDATVQMQVLLTLRDLQQRLGMGVIMVTHDLGVAAEICDRIAVMYAGRIVEIGRAQDVLLQPRHPYTRGLLAASLHGARRGTRRTGLAGAPPDLLALPQGCAFADRCSRAASACNAAVPALQAVSGFAQAACWRLDDSLNVGDAA
jgi:peptide/nickel transport system ATP-binding protein